jgi:uncharacterized protein YfaP (DUF2135 family)
MTGHLLFWLRLEAALWYTTTDLDLAVVDPYGEEINYFHRSSNSGGKLDQDANPGCQGLTSQPIENIFWPIGGAPYGTFTIKVRYFQQCLGNGATSFEVHVLVDGQETVYPGTIQSQGDEQVIATINR